MTYLLFWGELPVLVLPQLLPPPLMTSRVLGSRLAKIWCQVRAKFAAPVPMFTEWKNVALAPNWGLALEWQQHLCSGKEASVRGRTEYARWGCGWNGGDVTVALNLTTGG